MVTKDAEPKINERSLVVIKMHSLLKEAYLPPKINHSLLSAYGLLLTSLFLLWAPKLKAEALPLPAPKNFVWKSAREDTKNIFELRLYTKDEKPTDIFFAFNFLTGDLSEQNRVSSQYKIALTSPFEHNWQAHPSHLDEEVSSIEKFFEYALDHQQIEHKDLLRWNSELRTIHLKRIDEDFANLNKPSITYESLVEQVQNQIRHTRSILSPLRKTKIQKLLEEKWDNYDFLEAIQTQLSHSEHRVDAFTLTPLLTLRSEGEDLLKALDDFSHKPNFILNWFLQSREKFSETVRLSVAMLLTHNHLSEFNFIKGVAILYGVSRAWKAALSLNQAYKADRDYWQKFKIINTEYNEWYAADDIDFISERRLWSVDPCQHLKAKIKNIACSKSSLLPWVQIYHYYGAFISAYVMKSRLQLPSLSIPQLTQVLGLAYKLHTSGLKPRQLKIMTEMYSLGSRHALCIYEELTRR